MNADNGLSHKFGGLSLTSIPTLPTMPTRRRSSDVVVSPRVVDIAVQCIALKDALLSDTVSKELEALSDKKLAKVQLQIRSSVFMLNNYGTTLDAPAETKDGKITFTVQNTVRTLSESEVHADKKEIFVDKKYAVFADFILSKEHVANECHSFAIADGCGKGEGAGPAAQHATRRSLECLSIRKMKPRQIAALHVEALQTVQKELSEDRKKFGTTTLTMVTIAEDTLIATWVGDCKVFLQRADGKKRHFIDITASSRSNSINACDSGGCLGNNGELPDWGNVSTACVTLTSGDRVYLCTDGLYDNLDPLFAGKKPSDYGYKEAEWAPKNKVLRQFRQTELLKNFETLVADEPFHEIAPKLQKHLTELTHKRKMFLYDNPTEQDPRDYVAYPGKPDDSSAVILEVQITEKKRGSFLSRGH